MTSGPDIEITDKLCQEANEHASEDIRVDQQNFDSGDDEFADVKLYLMEHAGWIA